MREVTKNIEQKLEDHLNLDGNLLLVCDSNNGFIQAALQLLSHNKQFVRYFLSGLYQSAKGNVPKKKHFSMMLDNLFA